MTLEEALDIAREHDACEDDLHEIERCETWEKVLNHKEALFWVRWFADYLPTGLHPARDAYHEAMREARRGLSGTYSDAKGEKFDATRKAASEALLVEIKRYLEIEDTVTLADGKTYGVAYYRTEPSL